MADPLRYDFDKGQNLLATLLPRGKGSPAPSTSLLPAGRTGDAAPKHSALTTLRDVVRDLEDIAQSFLDTGRGVLLKTAAFYVGHNNENLDCVDASGGAVTATLLPASETRNIPFAVVKTDSSANAVTLTPDGSDTINGATTLTLSAQYDYVEVISDGTQYLVSHIGGTPVGWVGEDTPSRVGNVFTLTRAYTSGTLSVFYLGRLFYQSFRGTAQWSETSPSAGTFTVAAAWVTANLPGGWGTYHDIRCKYWAAD